MEIIKNYLKYSLWFVLIVFAVLLGLHWLPALTIDGHTMRRVDLLSDLRYPESETAAADSDSIPLPPVVKPVFVDTCRTGMTCIEDYSDSTLRGMTPFYKALDRVSSSDSDDKQVRIAVFGDSFIEADIFTVRAKDINDPMNAAAAHAIANLIDESELRADYIIPDPFDPRVKEAVSAAVAKVARETGAARI